MCVRACGCVGGVRACAHACVCAMWLHGTPRHTHAWWGAWMAWSGVVQEECVAGLLACLEPRKASKLSLPACRASLTCHSADDACGRDFPDPVVLGVCNKYIACVVDRDAQRLVQACAHSHPPVPRECRRPVAANCRDGVGEAAWGVTLLGACAVSSMGGGERWEVTILAACACLRRGVWEM